MEKSPSILPSNTKIRLFSDFTRGNSKMRDPDAGIHGVSVTMVSLRKFLPLQGYTDTTLITGQDLRFLKALPGRPHILHPVNPGRELRRLKKDTPDVVAAVVEGHLGIRVLRRAKRLNIPSIALYTTNVADYVRVNAKGIAKLPAYLITAPLLERLLKHAMNQADIVTVPAHEMVEKVTQFGVAPEKIRVLQRGIDRTLFKRVETGERNPYTSYDWYTKDGSGKYPKVILYTGRISPEKNYDELLQILGTLDPNQHVVFIGPPGTKKDTKILRNAEKAYPNFHLLGSMEHEELAPYYRFSDLFVTCSMSETFGHTINEAMASGIPVVVAKNQVMASRVDEGITGLTYQSGNPTSLKNAIAAGLVLKETVDPDIFDSYFSKQMISWDTTAIQFAKYANEAIQRRNMRNT